MSSGGAAAPLRGLKSLPRIFVGMNEVAGYFSSVTRGLRELGYEASFLDLSGNPLGYGRPQQGQALAGRLLWLATGAEGSWRKRLWRVLLAVHRLRKLIQAFLILPWAALRNEVFILDGRAPLLNAPGLALLRALGKTVVVIFTGSDHRPPYLNGIFVREAELGGLEGLVRLSQQTRRRVRQVESRAHHVVALPTSAQFHTRPFVNFLAVGIPFTQPDEVHGDAGQPSTSHAVRVLHSPTDPAKGTDRIRAAIQNLQDAGLEIEYRELIGRPNSEVLAAIRWADFVVDEVFSDTLMAGFSTEAAYFGRPAVIGGYEIAQLRDSLPTNLVPPSFICHPDALQSAIESLTRDETTRRGLGERASAFVRTEWTPTAVAGRLLQIVEREIPPEWWCDPDDIAYTHGWGLDEERHRAALVPLIRQFGVASLGLRPRMRERLLSSLGLRDDKPGAAPEAVPDS